MQNLLAYDNQIMNFLTDLEKEGIQIWTEEEKLKYRCKSGMLPKERLGQLKENKEALLAFEKQVMAHKLPLTAIQYAYLLGKEQSCELGGIPAHYYIEYEADDIVTDRLEAVLNQLIAQHDALRMVILQEGKMVFLRNCQHYFVTCYDSTELADRMKVREEWAHRTYEIGTWPMFHFQVGKSATGKDVLHVSFDCMILDAWSAKLLMERVFALYQGKEVHCPETPFASYMEQVSAIGQNEKAYQYWKKELEQFPLSPSLPMKKTLAEVTNMCTKRMEHRFSPAETERLNLLAKEKRLTPAAMICTVFMKILSEHSTNRDIAINITLFNRRPICKGVNEMLGEFTNNAVVKYEHSTGRTDLEHMKATQKQFWNLVQYRDFEGTRILNLLAENQVGKAVMPIVYTCMLGGEQKVPSLDFAEVYAISQTPQVMLDHHVRDDQGYLQVSWDYVEELFEETVMTELFTDYICALKKLLQ